MASAFSAGELRREAERLLKAYRRRYPTLVVHGRPSKDRRQQHLELLSEIVETLRELEKVESLPVF